MSPDLVPSGYVAEALAERCYDDIHCLRHDLEILPHVSALDDILAFFNDYLS